MTAKKSAAAAAKGERVPLDVPVAEEYVAAQVARDRAEMALRASEARYRSAMLTAQMALAKADALYRVANSLVAGESAEALLQRVVDAVAGALPADRVDLFAVDATSRAVTGNYRSGTNSARPYPVGFDELMEGLSGWVVRERKATLSAGGVRDKREPDPVHRRRVDMGHGPMVIAPILYRDRPLGVIVATNVPGGREFEPSDASLLSAMANQAAVSLEDANLRRQLEASHAELEERVLQRTAALAESEDRFRRITETVTDYVYHVDVAGGRVVATRHGPGCLAVTGYRPEDFEADAGLWLDMVVLDDREAVLAQAVEIESGKRVRPIEHRIVRKDGSVRWVRATAAPQYGRRGDLVGYDGLIQDVTERRELQEQLAQAQKLQSIGRLAGGVAHDFNNLLTAILGNAELAQMDLAEDHPAKSSLDEITRAAEAAARLTRQLLAFARRQMVEPVPLNLSDVVRGSLDMVGRLLGEDVEVVTGLDPEAWTVEADQGQVEQVIVNLVVNARDAMPRGGRVTIEVSNLVVGAEHVPERPDIAPGRYVLLSVSDTGSGMRKDVRDHVFEPFFTTKAPGQGIGLGLATCHGIVTQSGGFIWVHSEPGQGTSVRVLLPESRRHVSPAIDAAREPRSARGDEMILVVEDEASVRRLAVLGLRSHGYTVLEAANGSEALRVAATEHDIALVVSDVVMPGMRGPELAERLRTLRPNVQVLLMSGHSEALEAFRDGAGRTIPFLAKPFTPDQLAHRVRALLDEA